MKRVIRILMLLSLVFSQFAFSTTHASEPNIEEKRAAVQNVFQFPEDYVEDLDSDRIEFLFERLDDVIVTSPNVVYYAFLLKYEQNPIVKPKSKDELAARDKDIINELDATGGQVMQINEVILPNLQNATEVVLQFTEEEYQQYVLESKQSIVQPFADKIYTHYVDNGVLKLELRCDGIGILEQRNLNLALARYEWTTMPSVRTGCEVFSIHINAGNIVNGYIKYNHKYSAGGTTVMYYGNTPIHHTNGVSFTFMFADYKVTNPTQQYGYAEFDFHPNPSTGMSESSVHATYIHQNKVPNLISQWLNVSVSWNIFSVSVNSNTESYSQPLTGSSYTLYRN